MVRGFDVTHDIPILAEFAHLGPDELLSETGWEMKNSRIKIVHIAEMPEAEVRSLVEEIQAEGHNFVDLPTYEWEKNRLETTYISW